MPSVRPSFYQALPPFRNFSEVLDDSHYQEVPSDWYILLADVKGSMKWIEQGRYKQVNMIGAASITCVLNGLKDLEIPFVFGGDGATLVIPPESVTQVTAELKRLQAFAKKEFQMDLRVGLVALKDLRQQKYILKVAKYELSPGNYLAQFRGGAMARAEEMIKRRLEGAILLEPNEPELPPSLEGLSCRLDPLRSRKGAVLSLICRLRDAGSPETDLRALLEKLKNILNDDFKSASPVSQEKLFWKWIPSTFRDELRMDQQGANLFRAWLRTSLRVLIANFSLKLNRPLGPFNPGRYKSELVLNSDFKKFDDMLRMVVDCDPDQILAIEKLLKSFFEENRIYYGLHQSPEALMTCMVFSATQNQHIHFIDGAGGGYALAAVQMKKQISGSELSAES